MTVVAPLNLHQILNEMDVALAEEIEAQGSKPVKHVAINGKSLGEQNGLYLYDFSLQNSWRAQDDTPVSIRVTNTSRVTGTIIKAAGINILVSFEKPLTLEELQSINIYSDSTELTRRLREALKQAKDSERQLASKCFKLASFRCSTREPNDKFTTFGLDESQKKAASIAFDSEVSYIIGPPGTGKTHTLAAITYAYMSENRPTSILIAAHTNIAVDNAIKTLVRICHEKQLVLHEGQAVRFGVTDALEKPIYHKASIPKITERRTLALSKRKEEITVRLRQIRDEKAVSQKECERRISDWEVQRPQYLAQHDSYKNTIVPIQVREQQRTTAIHTQMQQAESKLSSVQREVENAKQALAQTVHQQVQLKSLMELHLSQANTREIALADAQQMNRIKRLFKGVNIEKISDEVAQAKHTIWQDEQHLYTLQSRIQTLHIEQSRVEKLVNQYFQEYNAVRYQSTLPSSDKQQIVQLQAELTQLEAHIAQRDELQKQQRKQKDVQDRHYKNEIESLEEEQTSISKQLQDVEKKIVAEAQIVATTLSKIYMNPALTERKFDVIIMDEVSMISLPLAYVTACHANKTVIALGDPQQLPPIVQAETEVAKKWLGKSLFDYNLISLDKAASRENGNSAILKNQSRMHPDISIIASKHIYKNQLLDSHKVLERQPDYANVEPLKGKHVLLCDTREAAPIATKPEGGSRINIYNALCTMAIAKQVLDTLPQSEKDGSNTKQIGIVTPYAKQAELFDRLVVDAGLEGRIHPGTVHRFQGLEYDVIIFDTVDSGFFKPRRDFIKGGHDSDAMRLINVAITRARHKLIIVANSSYIRKEFTEEDTLRLVTKDASMHTINSNSIFTVPFSKIASISQKMQPQEQKSTEVFFKELRPFDEQSFFEAFKQDLQTAKEEIIIVSPFLAVHRTSFLQPLLQGKRINGVKVLVVTKPLNEYDIVGREEAEQMLKNADIDIQYRRGIHIKLAIIDNKTVYHGSLNILSHKDTIESMIRLNSARFAEAIRDFEGLNGSPKSYKKSERTIEQRENDITISCNELPKLKCACGRDMRATVGRYGPFYGCVSYAKCTQKDKNKDIAEEHLRNVSRLTNVSCSKCSSSTPMVVKVNRREAWLECTNTTSCGYKRNILVTKN